MTPRGAHPAHQQALGQTALAELRKDGMTVLRGVIAPAAVAQLSRAVQEERDYLSRADPAGLARTSPVLGSPAHTGFLCPYRDPFISAEILASPLLRSVTDGYLDAPVYLHEIVVNFALAGQDCAQAPHPDQEPEPRGPVGVVWNIPTCPVGPENGMTAIYPGTHHRATLDGGTPVQPRLNCGDVLIRDLSLVHNGAPNLSRQDRALLAYVVKPDWQDLPADFVAGIEAGAWLTLEPARTSLLRRHHKAENGEVPRGRAYPIPESLL